MNVSKLASKPVTCRPDSTLEEIARHMVECDCGMIPIIDEKGQAVGTVTDRDITCRAVAQGQNPLSLKASDVMTSPAITVAEDAELETVAKLFEDKQIRRAIVADGSGCCLGVISQADVARNARPEIAAEVVRHVSKPTDDSARV